jgi:hypothetical protein
MACVCDHHPSPPVPSIDTATTTTEEEEGKKGREEKRTTTTVEEERMLFICLFGCYVSMY